MMIRWGIIGAGNIAHRFAKSLQYENDAVLYAISGRNEEKMKAFQEEYPCEKICLSYDALIEDENVDAVYVALPNELHCEYVMKALKNHKPVLCEKPAAVNSEEMNRMIDCAIENNTLFMEAMKTRLEPAYIKIRDFVNSDKAGKVKKVYAGWSYPMDPNETKNARLFSKSCGGLLDNGIYSACWLAEYMGDDITLEKVRGQLLKNDCNIYAEAKLSDGKVKGKIVAGLDRHIPSGAIIECENCTIEIEGMHRPVKALVIYKDGSSEEISEPYVNDDFYAEIHHFNELVKNDMKESDVITYAFSKKMIRIIDMITDGLLEYDENDLKILEEQEKILSFDHFDAPLALKIGNAVAQCVKNYDREVSVRIVRESDGMVMFQYMMDSKTPKNEFYMEGKREVSLKCGHSSAWAYVKNRIDGSYEGMMTASGAFPIFVNGERVAMVTVSGLHEGKDHDLVTDALSIIKDCKVPVFFKGLR